MSFTFYHSPLCPRCARTKKHLRELLGEELQDLMVSVDVLKHPVKAWRENIRMIPALKCGQDIASGVTLPRARVTSFLVRNGLLDPPGDP